MTPPTRKPSFGVLDGAKVAYSAVEIVAPTAAATMAEWGADITQIENVWTGGSMCDAARVKEVERRNIRSISMNPFTEDGKEALRAIIKGADIFIEFGKGPIYARKDITDESLWEINPKFVIVHVSGSGQWGDEEQINSTVYDLTVAAYAGIVAQDGSINQPMNIFPYLNDYINSLMIISSTLVALHRVSATGEGESIDMAMYRTPLWVGTYYTMDCMNVDILYPHPGTRHQNLCGIGIYECKDGLIGLCLYGVSQSKYLFGTIGLGRLWETEKYPEGISVSWLNSPEADLIQRILEEHLKIRSRFDVRHDLVAHRVTAQVVNEFSDILTADHVKARECFIDSEKADGTPVKVLSTFPKLRHNSGAFWRSMPALGEDTRSVLKRVGHSDEDIGHPAESGTAKIKGGD